MFILAFTCDREAKPILPTHVANSRKKTIRATLHVRVRQACLLKSFGLGVSVRRYNPTYIVRILFARNRVNRLRSSVHHDRTYLAICPSIFERKRFVESLNVQKCNNSSCKFKVT